MLARLCFSLVFAFAALTAVAARAQVFVPMPALSTTIPMRGIAPLLMFQSFCVDRPEEDALACDRLAKADKAVEEAARTVKPDRDLNDFERAVAAAKLCGGGPRGRGEDYGAACAAWRDAVEQRAKACAVLEARRTEEAASAAPKPVTRSGGIVLPVIRVGASEQVASVGQPLQLAGLVGHDDDVPSVRINGQAVALMEIGASDQPVARKSRAFRVDVPTDLAGTHIYVIEACDSSGACFGKDLVVRVLERDGPASKGQNHALVIGADEYKALPPLKTAVADAREVARLLTERYQFEAANVKLLINPGREAILSQLSALRDTLGPDDRLLIYYAGHGQIEQATNEGFWQPADARPKDDFTWISNGDLRRYLRGMSARHVLVVADSCFSGALTRSASYGYGQPPASKDRFFAETDGKFSRKVITSGGTEPVADAGSGGHSVFAFYFLKALRDNNATYLTSFELFNGFVRAVVNNANQRPEYGTIAMAGDEGAGDFTFALRN